MSATTGLRALLLPAAVRERVAELVRTEPSVRALERILEPRKIHEWALTIGTLTDPVLRALAPPLPDDALRRITADDEPELFLWSGLIDVHAFLELLERYGRPSPPRPRGRMSASARLRLRMREALAFLRGAIELELHGVDVNADHVDWCRRHLAPIAFEKTALEPPLPFERAHFDGIWSLSVFTHLSEELGLAWREELARILAPGGILILTVQGETALAKAEADPEFAARLGWTHAHVQAARSALARSGHGSLRYDARSLADAKAGEDYGSHYATEAHVRRHWLHSGLELLEFQPGGLRGWQDIVVLRKRGG
jgi:SAM-dependent methyltransferase